MKHMVLLNQEAMASMIVRFIYYMYSGSWTSGKLFTAKYAILE